MTKRIRTDLTETPEGTATAWVLDKDKRIISPHYQYDTLEEALVDMPLLLIKTGGKEAVLNYKHPEGIFLDVYILNHWAHFPKLEPFSLRKWWNSFWE